MLDITSDSLLVMEENIWIVVNINKSVVNKVNMLLCLVLFISELKLSV